MSKERTFREQDIQAAVNGAEVYYWNGARDAVVALHEGMTLTALINHYCTDAELAKKQVSAYLADLPTNGELVARAFTFFELLRSTRNELAEIVGLERDLLEEAARGKKDKVVDDDRIRESAGYSDETDSEVAENSKTDLARKNKVTDDQIGESVSEEVTYKDRTAGLSPAITFMLETQRLARGICDHCLQGGDINLLVQADVVDEDPTILAKQVLETVGKLEPPRDEDK